MKKAYSLRALFGALLTAGAIGAACSSHTRDEDTTPTRELGQSTATLPSNPSVAPADAAETTPPPIERATPLSTRPAQPTQPAQPAQTAPTPGTTTPVPTPGAPDGLPPVTPGPTNPGPGPTPGNPTPPTLPTPPAPNPMPAPTTPPSMQPLRAGAAATTTGGRAATTLHSDAIPMQLRDAGVPITPAPRDGGIGGAGDAGTGGGTRDAGIGSIDAGLGGGGRDAGVVGTADGGMR